MTVRAKARAGIEEVVFSIDTDDGDVVVELVEGEIVLDEQTAATIGDPGKIGLEPSRAGLETKRRAIWSSLPRLRVQMSSAVWTSLKPWAFSSALECSRV